MTVCLAPLYWSTARLVSKAGRTLLWEGSTRLVTVIRVVVMGQTATVAMRCSDKGAHGTGRTLRTEGSTRLEAAADIRVADVVEWAARRDTIALADHVRAAPMG